MNKAKIIEGLNETINGLTILRDAINSGETTATDDTPKTQKKTAPVETTPAATSEKSANGKFDPDQLNSMPYNEFKKLAAQLGVSCKGTRDEIMSRVMTLDVTTNENGDAEASDPEPETAPAEKNTKKRVGRKSSEDETPTSTDEKVETKSDRPASGKRGLVKKTAEPTPDEFDTKAKEIADNTPVEDIIDALSEVGVKATKKNYLTELAAALREGKLEVDDDEDTADEPEAPAAQPDNEGEDEDEISAESYFPEYDPEGFNDPETMTDERRDAVVTKMDEVLTAYSEGDLAPQEVTDYLTEKATQDELDLLGDDPSDDEMLKAYMELVKRTIDNDGEEHTEQGDPYELGEHDMCCGHKLKYVAKTKKYICEMCGSEFEAE